jgi:hypothetical protein
MVIRNLAVGRQTHSKNGGSDIMTIRHGRLAQSASLLIVFLAIGAAARTADFKKGSYSVTGGDVKWSLNFGENNKVSVLRNGEVAVEGTYKVNGDELSLSDETGPMACGGEQKIGKYKWKLEDKKLTLTKVQDLCEGRSGALTSQVWVRE